MELKYTDYSVTFQELPNQVALTFWVSNCPNRCPGCHTPELRENIGNTLTYDSISPILDKYADYVDAICFLGHGDTSQTDLFVELVQRIRKDYKRLRIGLYSGFDDMVYKFIPILDYYKIGSYIERRGAINDRGTNQRMFRLSEGQKMDITHEFWENN